MLTNKNKLCYSCKALPQKGAKFLNKKTLKKLLTRQNAYDIISRLSRNDRRTLIIKQ